MIITFQVILLALILLTIMGVIGEVDDQEQRTRLTSIAIASIIAFALTVIFA